MNKIVLDTETSGLPLPSGLPGYSPPFLLQQYSTSRIVELAFIVLDEKNTVVYTYSSLVQPEGFEITNSHIHGITQEKALKEGKNIKTVLAELYEALKTCRTVIGHNIDFDYNIILSECYRAGCPDIIKLFSPMELYCTMKNAKIKYNLLKKPKLTELFSLLYPAETWVQKHNALEDTEKCLKCYRKMME